MRSLIVGFTVFLFFGVVFCEDEPCMEADGCYLDVVDPKWVGEMNDAFVKKASNVKVKEILKIVRRVKDNGNEIHTKAEILAEDGRTCYVTWVETAQHADDWIPDMGVECAAPAEVKTA